MRKMLEIGKAWQAGGESEALDHMALLEDPEVMEFARFVRVPEDQPVEFDGEPADSRRLFKEGNGHFLMNVLTAIQRLAALNEVEGKASSSPSISSVGEPSAPSAGRATSTAVEACPSPSTATPILPSIELSTAP